MPILHLFAIRSLTGPLLCFLLYRSWHLQVAIPRLTNIYVAILVQPTGGTSRRLQPRKRKQPEFFSLFLIIRWLLHTQLGVFHGSSSHKIGPPSLQVLVNVITGLQQHYYVFLSLQARGGSDFLLLLIVGFPNSCLLAFYQLLIPCIKIPYVIYLLWYLFSRKIPDFGMWPIILIDFIVLNFFTFICNVFHTQKTQNKTLPHINSNGISYRVIYSTGKTVKQYP